METGRECSALAAALSTKRNLLRALDPSIPGPSKPPVLAPPRPCRIAGEATRLAGTGHGGVPSVVQTRCRDGPFD